ncbi:MAG: hypothetical protein GX620_08235 [Chloroflexi bacterium]|nr:hypothetical protein [Chloroflexota bacterium]
MTEESTTQEAPIPHRVTAMEMGSMPLDPIYAWSIVLEPVDVLIEQTSDFIERLAREKAEQEEDWSDEELERRFLGFFKRLVQEGTLRRLPDAEPAMGRQILGPHRWLHAQRIRIDRLVALWREEDGDLTQTGESH